MNSLFKPTSYAKGTAQAVAATFVWKFISFINALLLAAYFGATYKTDIYFYVVMVIGFAVAFVQRLNQTVLIPEAMFLHEKSTQSARSFLTMWFYIYGVAGLLCTTAGSLFAVHGWGLLSRFSADELARQQMVLLLGAGWFGLQLLSYYLQAIAEMFKYFAAAWLGALNALFPLVCLLSFGKQVGPVSMLYGFVAANVVQIGLLLYTLKIQGKLSWTFTWQPIPRRARQNMLAGQSLAVLDIVNSLLPVYLMSGYNAGVITALNYCRQFTDSSTEIFTARTANITKIALTETAARQQDIRFNEQFLLATQLLVLILAPLAVFSCYFAPQIIALFFQRGEFTPEATHQTVLFLRPMLFVMLLSAPGYLQNSAIAACRQIKINFPYALTTGMLLTGLLWLVIPHYGAFSYPYLLGIGLLTGFLLNAFFFRKNLPFVEYGKQLWLTVKITSLAAVSLIPAIGLATFFNKPFWQIVVCGTVFVSVYAWVCLLSKDGKFVFQFLRHNF